MSVPKNRVAVPSRSADTQARLFQPITLHAQDDIRRALEAILDSPEFSGSHRGQMLLRYLVENALEGGLERLKERTIGVELFHREPSYDTGQDAIVRVAANDVRKRLAAHYQHFGTARTGSGVRISLAPGSYVPDFETIEKGPPDVAELPLALPSHPAEARTWHRDWIQWAAIAALATVCSLLAIQNVKLRSTTTQPSRLAIQPWSQIATPGTTVTLVGADVNFALYKRLLQAEQSLDVYTSQRWLDQMAIRLPSAPDLSRMPYTSIADASIAARIGGVLKGGGCSISVRSGRMMQVDDFKSERSVILMGSAFSNPWVALLNDRLNFHIEYDSVSGKQLCKNASPRKGESSVYVGSARTPMPGVGYATISLVRNLSHNGFVLLIAGTNMEGTEAAGELVTDLPRLTSALRNRGIDPTAKVEQLELLMRLDHMGSQSSRSEIIAHRVTL